MHQKTWSTNGNHSTVTRVATKPGQFVSVDKLESLMPVFIVQLKGNLTKQQYRYTTIFIDQYSCLSYVFLQQTITSDEMVQAKIAFEWY